MKYIYLLLSSPLFYLFFQNDFLWSLPCLFSVVVVGFVGVLSYFISIKFLKSKEKSKVCLYILGVLFWMALPAGKFFKPFVACNAELWEKTKFFSPLVVFLLFFFCFFLSKRLNDEISLKINKFFSVFTTTFIAILGLNILTRTAASSTYKSGKIDLSQNLSVKSLKHPNVYHILLDAHSSNYVLKKYCNFDNSKFYQNLRSKGFSIIEPSFSQYPATQMSVASMLNLEYLPAKKIPVADLERLRFNNKVFAVFYENDYRVHVFDRTLQMSYGPQFKKANNSNYALYWLWIQHTPLKWFFQRKFQKYMCLDHADNIELDLRELELAKKRFGSHNNLFYAHIVCPHAPFIYGEDGSFDVSQGLIGMFTDNRGALAENNEQLELLKQKYLSTLKIIDKKILELIQAILSQYEENEKPIIVLHSDHGTCLTTISPLLFDAHKVLPSQLNAEQEQLYGNLLSIYCPSYWQPEKVPLSLVNLYRFVFNNLFNEKYEYLENFCCIKD